MRAGKLDTRIRIDRMSTTQDAAGAQVNTWVAVAYRWASVEPLVGREFLAAQQRGGKVQTRFRLRYYEGITPAMRIVWTIGAVTRYFDITDVQIVQGKKHEMIVMADELVNVSS